ncbi:MAG: hypothetical protein JNL28_12140 [Planctomycetes bacterium]|nr:hypothetical protein [Planctomycetota bacterium]
MSLLKSSALALALAFCASCSAPHAAGDGNQARYLYEHLGSHKRVVTTSSAQAQAFFDQGLVLAYAFNHDEAIRSFKAATELDPNCAMAWWGIALAHGPHINFNAMTPEASAAAWDALQNARLHAPRSSPVEQALIAALSERYASPPPDDRAPLDAAYADAMRATWRRFSTDADVGALTAEALMDLHPWDLWTTDGEARPWTPEIVALLDTVLALDAAHPLANHLYVHALEASNTPGRADAAADRLRALVPDASHLVHMPAHIDARMGRYAAASHANELAIAVDKRHADRTGRAGFYRVYMAHNVHFLSFSAMMEGRRERALSAGHALVDGFTPEFLESLGPFIDGFLPIVLEVQVRFGMWEEILREPPFPDLFGVSNSVRHYARGVAFTALGRFDEARRELALLEELCGVMDERPIGNNPARTVLRIPQLVLRGELAFGEGRQAEGIEHLRAAVAVEDTLLYDEPPDWIMPVRHTLGALLVAAGKYEEAEQAYREDLRRFPNNGWSLQGLLLCYEARGEMERADEVRAAFNEAWANSDVKLTSSCFCQARR